MTPPPRCELCGTFLSCQTDTFQMVRNAEGKVFQGYGRMQYIHDGPCNGRNGAEVKRPISTIKKKCIECGEMFDADVDAPATAICDDDCRNNRQRRLAREKYERSKLPKQDAA